MFNLMDEFEALMEEQFQLDLISDRQVEDQETYDKVIQMYDQNISAGIADCLHRMNKRR